MSLESAESIARRPDGPRGNVGGQNHMRRVVLATLAALACLLALPGWAWMADDFGTRVAGQHVYDRAGVLTPDQIQTVESKAAALEQAGTPTIVYVQVKQAT